MSHCILISPHLNSKKWSKICEKKRVDDRPQAQHPYLLLLLKIEIVWIFINVYYNSVAVTAFLNQRVVSFHIIFPNINYPMWCQLHYLVDNILSIHERFSIKNTKYCCHIIKCTKVHKGLMILKEKIVFPCREDLFILKR